jgi:hypothetical protein
MRKSIVKRLRKIEQQTFMPRWRVVVKDYDGLYRGECGQGLTQEQFDVWVRGQDSDTQVIIVEVGENFEQESKPQDVTFRVENHASMNGVDLLKGYEESMARAHEANLMTYGLQKYSVQEKTAILDAYRIIREHYPLVPVEGCING